MTVDVLKQKVINDFCDLVTQLEKGSRPSCQLIMNELNLIDVYEFLDENKRQTLLQLYINHDKI